MAEAAGSSKTLLKAVALLDALAKQPGLSLADLSRLTELPKPTAHRVLAALVEERLVRVDSDGAYRLGVQCFVLGTAFLEGLDLRTEARGPLEDLVGRCDETCHLGVLDGQRIVYLEKVESGHAVRMHSRIGSTNPAHSTGLGKAILAHCDEAVVDAVVAAGLRRRTPQTITDPDRLRDELARIRRRGYAVDDAENEDGIRCVAAPVLDHKREVVAGISVAGPTYRLSRERAREFSGHVLATARTLSQRIGYPGELPVEEERRT